MTLMVGSMLIETALGTLLVFLLVCNLSPAGNSQHWHSRQHWLVTLPFVLRHLPHIPVVSWQSFTSHRGLAKAGSLRRLWFTPLCYFCLSPFVFQRPSGFMWSRTTVATAHLSWKLFHYLFCLFHKTHALDNCLASLCLNPLKRGKKIN